MFRQKGQIRAIIRNVYPCVENGKYAIKRVQNEEVNVWADVFADGHDVIRASIQYRHSSEKKWHEVPAFEIDQDRWHAKFIVAKIGTYYYRFTGWADYALYWQYGIAKKADAGLDVSIELLEAEPFLSFLLKKTKTDEKKYVQLCINTFTDESKRDEAIKLAKSAKLTALFQKYPNQPFVEYSDPYRLEVEREKAVFSTWYEFFPRSSSNKQNAHGTLKDCIKLLPRVAEFGFDTLYFPPIHPIGYINRKGKNNTTSAGADDVGSCWGIGSTEGGHTDIHPQLGTIKDFESLVKEAKKLGIEIAMDFALQATPDHPWVEQHPTWFKQRPDGTIQYAENPPKKYQDIYPIYFETEDWENMWVEFLNILFFWIKKGIRVFRVDNPHTKPFIFWEWIIAAVKEKHPEVIFLSEAFSRPKVMEELGKLGFSQSYTYYTWRNNKHEIIEYVNELTNGLMSETYRPNFWPNTPDILPFALQNKSTHIYYTRYFMAATLSSNVGVYGPVYELMVNEAINGKEEYFNSEKFEIGHWDWKERNTITQLYTIVNKTRREVKALQRTNNITFLQIDNDQLLAYLKVGTDGSKVICVVSLDGHHPQASQLHLHPSQIGKEYHDAIELTDALTGNSYTWHGHSHFIQLSPEQPCHLFIIK
jgi:starch synthase (maltosyl-transferring)